MVKAKIVAIILCLALIATGSFIGGSSLARASGEDSLSRDSFPETVVGLPLLDVVEADLETALGFDIPIKKGYGAVYGNEDKIVMVYIFQGQSEAAVSEWVDELVYEGPSEISAINEEFSGLIEFAPIDQVSVKGYSCASTSYEIYAQGQWINGRLMVMGADSHMIIVHSMSGVGDPGLSQTKKIVETFYGKLPRTSATSTPKPTPTPVPTLNPEQVALLSQIDKAEVATLTAVLWHVDSMYHSAVKSKVRFGFMVGQLMEMYDVDLDQLKELLGSELWEKLDYAYDLDKIDSLRSYCRKDDLDGFSEKYEEYAERKVREEFSFNEAQDRICEGFENMRASIRNGTMDEYLDDMDWALYEYAKYVEYERLSHAESMAYSQEAARIVTECAGLIDKLTSLANRLFGNSLDKAKLASSLSLVWAQDQVRYWTTTAYLWGGTEKLRDNLLERLREQFNLFEREEVHYGPVFAAEEGLDKIARGIPIE